MMNTKKTDFQINSTKVTIKIQWFITEIALLLNKTETNLLATKHKHISKPKDFEKGRENKIRFETEQLKNNINKAAFNMFFKKPLFIIFKCKNVLFCCFKLFFDLITLSFKSVSLDHKHWVTLFFSKFHVLFVFVLNHVRGNMFSFSFIFCLYLFIAIIKIGCITLACTLKCHDHRIGKCAVLSYLLISGFNPGS